MSYSTLEITEEDKKLLSDFANRVGIEIKDYTIYREALTHRSYLNENSGEGLRNNERLEYLGDAVLELITTEYLFSSYADRPEGDLTSFRAALVRTESLAEEALRLDLGEFIYMSNGEERTGGRKRPYILANTFEAILGAMYLDGGYALCDDFINRELIPKIEHIVENRLDIDAKSKLQEIAQELIRSTPTYELVEASGPDHSKTFTMAVYIDNMQFGTGKGRSKQDAEQKAARYALQNWDNLYQKYKNSGKISPS